MRALIIGQKGQMAQALCRMARHAGIEAEARGRAQFDTLSEKAIAAAIEDLVPDIVINTAAYTAVDKAEHDVATAFAVNADGAEAVARAAAKAGLPLLHLSTDHVFDGKKRQPYVEQDVPNPINVYGRSKLAGETAIANCHDRCVIVRLQWIYASHGANFLHTMLRLAEKRGQLRVVADQLGCPTLADDAAIGLLDIAAQICSGKRQDWGLFHMSALGQTSWHGFAQAIFSGARARGGSGAEVEAITSADYPTAAKRPADSRLDCTKLAATYGVHLPDWHDGLERCLDQAAANGWNWT